MMGNFRYLFHISFFLIKKRTIYLLYFIFDLGLEILQLEPHLKTMGLVLSYFILGAKILNILTKKR